MTILNHFRLFQTTLIGVKIGVKIAKVVWIKQINIIHIINLQYSILLLNVIIVVIDF